MNHTKVNDLAASNPEPPQSPANPPQGDTTINSELEEYLVTWIEGVITDARNPEVLFNYKSLVALQLMPFIKQWAAQEANKARIGILERLCCCDHEPTKGPAINVCDGDHLKLAQALTSEKGSA